MAELFDFAQAPAQVEDTRSELPPDHVERELALDITRSWIVEAPAGSGKTGLLIQRYLKLLTDEQVTQPEQVLAITFTEKATAEIKERITAQLEAANGPDRSKSRFDRTTRELAQAVLERDAAMGWGFLERPHRMNVRTIDSICAEVTRALPLLSGVGSAYGPVEDPEPLYREAARRTLNQLGGDDSALTAALRVVLLHRDGKLDDVERLIAEMLRWRDQWGPMISLRGEALSDDFLDTVVRSTLEQTLERFVSAELATLAQRIPPDFLQELSTLAASLSENPPCHCDVSPVAIFQGHPHRPGTSADQLDLWRALIHLLVSPSSWTWRRSFARNYLKLEITPTQKGQLKSLCEQVEHRNDVLEAMGRVNNLPSATYPDDQWRVAKALFRVLSRALIELQIVFAEKSGCDFAELSLLARAALKNEEGLDALETAQGLHPRHLLIDEMQDTSTSQYELIELLTQGWSGTGQTVFLVGDPKQSIYLFREARVERFLQTMRTDRIGDLSLGSLRLTANFRSQSRLIDAFNRNFSAIFPNIAASLPEEVPFVAASAIRDAADGDVKDVVWHANPLPAGRSGNARRTEKRHRSEEEAQAIRAIIQQWRSRPLPPGRTKPWKIAVLVSSRSHLTHIVRALNDGTAAERIPFRAVDIETLSDRQEIIDLCALTRSLLHPADRVAWLAVLRAPWCGLPLSELYRLAEGDSPHRTRRSMEEAVASRRQLLSEEDRPRVERVWSVLHAALEQYGRLPIAQLVERTWRSLGGDLYLTTTEQTNAQRFFELLDRLEEDLDTIDITTLQQQLSNLYAEPETNPDAVDLMTIHGSKGLEWDVVIVPSLEKKVGSNESRLLQWSELNSSTEDIAHFMLAPIVGKGENPRELNQWLSRIRADREAAEAKRLFYVACTRAQEELHLFAAPKITTKGKVAPEPKTLLKAAWPAAHTHFPAQLFPLRPAIYPEETSIERIAAEAATIPLATTSRLPLDVDPRARLKAKADVGRERHSTPDQISSFTRPEGSFEARALGNTTHSFLEALGRRIQLGASSERLISEIGRWDRRIRAALRGEGLPSDVVDRLLPQVMLALENTLRDPDGLWILAQHDSAASEYGITTWEDRARSIRIDRTFRAGNQPRSHGDDYLWIIDYKTTTHGAEDRERFMDRERTKYAAQLEAYARIMQRNAKGELRLGLYYPMLPRLVWWEA
jgi:ATP-dependent helicase/nuclease subunit A